MRVMITILALLVGLMSGVPQGWCEDADEGFNNVGVRIGFPGTSRQEYFHQYEAFTSYGLPWSIRSASGWGIALQVNAAAGALHAAKETGFIGAIGPGVIFDKAGGKGVALFFGGDLNILSKYRFGQVNLNGHYLFDGHGGIMYRFESGPGIGYRFQHMSNAGLGTKRNTGLDLNMFEVSWNFH